MSASFLRTPERAAVRQKRSLAYAYLLATATLLVVPMLMITAKRGSMVETGYRISELRKENAKLREQQMRLRADYFRLTRPNRIFEKSLALGLRPVTVSSRVSVSLRPLPQDEPFTPDETLVANLDEEP